LQVRGQPRTGSGSLRPDPIREGIVELALLGHPGLDARLVPGDSAAVLGKRPAVDRSARSHSKLGGGYFEPYPLARRGQDAFPQPLRRAVFPPVNHVVAPVGTVQPAPFRVPLKHQLFGRITRFYVDMSEETVSTPKLELAPRVVEEALGKRVCTD